MEVVENPLEAPISEKMFKSAPKMGSFKLGDSTLSSMIESYANSGDFDSVEKLLSRIRLENRVIIERSFIVVFRAYGKAHLPDKAVDLFHRMVDEFRCKRSVKSFNSVLNVIINEGLYHRGLEFYDYVVNSNMNMNISPNGLSFNLVIKALCKLRFVDRAIEVFRGMPERKCLPDGYTYCTLMDGLCKEERIDEAVLLLDEMQSEGCSPSPVIYNVLIDGLSRKGI
jgi:pentatricopeptide repeat protein